MKKYTKLLPATRLKSKDEVRASVGTWAKSLKAPTPTEPRKIPIKASRFTAKDLDKLTTIHTSKYSIAEMIYQKLPPSDLVSLLFSSLMIYKYYKMREAHKQKKEWGQIVAAAVRYLSQSGLPNLKEADLDGLCNELCKNPANLKTVSEMSETAVMLQSGIVMSGQPQAIIDETTTMATLMWGVSTDQAAPDLCAQPIDSTTSVHIGPYGFSFDIEIPYWCPTWDDWFRICWARITVAGFSFEADLEVGYHIDCHEMTAWGWYFAQACVTVLNISFCSDCSAFVSGIGTAESSSIIGMCTYGYGLTTSVQCFYDGFCVFSLTIPLGVYVEAPCQ
jgi:hypothetical protein